MTVSESTVEDKSSNVTELVAVTSLASTVLMTSLWRNVCAIVSLVLSLFDCVTLGELDTIDSGEELVAPDIELLPDV